MVKINHSCNKNKGILFNVVKDHPSFPFISSVSFYWMEFQTLIRSLSFEKDRVLLFQVEQEILQFIRGKDNEHQETVLQFPSMTAHHRWIVHATAERFNLKSQSSGWVYAFTLSFPFLNRFFFMKGFDKPTRIHQSENTKEPLLKYVDFIPQKRFSPLISQDVQVRFVVLHLQCDFLL